jgi:hypothetical protein
MSGALHAFNAMQWREHGPVKVELGADSDNDVDVNTAGPY